MTRTAQIEFKMLTSFDHAAQPLDYLFLDPSFREEDEARLKGWRNDEWHFVGIRAKALIKVPFGSSPESWITTELLSPGLWGIESDSGDWYFEQVYQDEREILVGILDSLKPSNHDRFAYACRLLVQAYANGEETQHVDWDEVDLAYDAARAALAGVQS